MSNELQATRFMDSIPIAIETLRAQATRAKTAFTDIVNQITALQPNNIEHIQEINSYNVGDSASKDVLKSKLAAFQPIYQVLQTQAESAIVDLNQYTEF